ncbi:MAG: cryptochrome/photolyase family protein, partial [Acidobacteria bacterium]|nr:cryptochrome/photolyase family protein [Acidobacteriota bacterium]
FYRHVRSRLRVLMQGRQPAGGRWSLDQDNREPWPGHPEPPSPPSFTHDAVTEEVATLVRERFAAHPGRVELGTLSATAGQADQMWTWACASCLPSFGRYEDAMSSRSAGLFHTRISPLLNVHRLLPANLVRQVEGLDAPLASREGFIRQILGWREYVRHVHEATAGFTRLGSETVPRGAAPGDGGYQRWSGRAWPIADDAAAHGGSRINMLDADLPLPVAWWGQPSGLHCLDRVVADVWRDAWSHHITRLMVLSNIASLIDANPRELTDWFWVAYVDAYDWVVEPNVLGMSTYATGPSMTTKPYVAGAAYINRMSDYCRGCAFDPRRTCPLTRLYWAYLARHEDALDGNQRMTFALGALARRSAADRTEDARVFEDVRDRLSRGERLDRPPIGPSA